MVLGQIGRSGKVLGFISSNFGPNPTAGRPPKGNNRGDYNYHCYPRTTVYGIKFASNCLGKKWYQVFTDFLHNLYIRRLPGPSPRFLLGFYPYLPRDLQDSEGKTYQKPIRKNNEKIKIIIKINLYSFFSYFYLQNFFHLPICTSNFVYFLMFLYISYVLSCRCPGRP